MITLATIPAILALVNLAKKFGLQGPWAAALAALLGVLLAEADYLFGSADLVVSASGVYSAGAAGLILGLSASGLYDVTSKIADRIGAPGAADRD